MSYQVLARKWRPQKFSELVGQEHVVNAITNALENNKLHHAYLFSGTRGVGKTTIARIFSKSLNCEQGQSANPCGTCSTCVDISDGRYVDLLEIDAASRTKVEDTRELLDNVQYRPTRGKYKVYLIDEVHMLSKHSFNALLKTLEEPPEHVKFLLATTDPQKLPVTILSRCLQFNLKALSKDQIQNHLAYILEQESIEFETTAIEQLSKAAQGSIRDSLSLTDQAIAQGNNKVTFTTVASMLGLLNRNHLIRLLKFISERNGKKSLEVLEEICSQTPDFAQILSQIVALIHQIALTQIVPDICKLENESAKALYTLSKVLSKEHIQVLYQIGINGKRDLNFAPDARAGLEMTVLRMIAFSPAQAIPINIDDLINSESEKDEKYTLSSERREFQTGEYEYSSAKEKSKLFSDSNQLSTLQTEHPSTHKLSTREDVSSDQSCLQAGQSETNDSKKVIDKSMEPTDGSFISDQSNFVNLDHKNENNHPVNVHETPVSKNQIATDAQQLEIQPPTEKNGQNSDPANNLKENELLNEITHDHIQNKDNTDMEPRIHKLSKTDKKGPNSPNETSAQIPKSSYMRTLELLRAEKEIDELNINEDNGQKNSPIESKKNRAIESTIETQTDYKIGYVFKPFTGELSAFLNNDEKLVSASQVDEWSAFVDTTDLQAYSRVFLLNTNCKELQNPLEVVVNEENMKLCTQEVKNNIEAKLSEMFERKVALQVETGETVNTPYSLQQNIKEIRLAHARSIVSSDESIQELKKAFDADVLQDSIEVRPKKQS